MTYFVQDSDASDELLSMTFFYMATLNLLNLNTNFFSESVWSKICAILHFAYEAVTHKCHSYTQCDHLTSLYPIEPVWLPHNQLFNQTLPVEVLKNSKRFFHSTHCCPAEFFDIFYKKSGYTRQSSRKFDQTHRPGD